MPDARSVAPSPTLPVPPTPLLGREGELATARRLLDAGCRLLTLTGPAGVGKTRLALAVAEERLAAFPDGARFVDLAPLAGPTRVLPSIAHALGVRGVAEDRLPDAMKAYLRHRRLLLVLDNLEHLLAAAAEVDGLLAACRELTVVVTSREPLRLRRE